MKSIKIYKGQSFMMSLDNNKEELLFRVMNIKKGVITIYRYKAINNSPFDKLIIKPIPLDILPI